MPFAVLTPLPASTESMSHPTPSNNRLRLHPSPGMASARSAAARESIISSSAKGWSPLQINKRDGAISPLRQSPNPSLDPSSPPGLTVPGSDGPRRTSNSFKHVTRNSLVANSPFKNLGTVQGQQAAGMEVAQGKAREVIHERRTEGRRMGEAQPSAEGAGATPRAAIGLGISAKPRSASRSASGSRSAVSGSRKVSTEKVRVSIPSSSGESRRTSGGERRVSADKSSGTKENESPSLHTSQRIPRQSSGIKGLKEGSHVSRSPFKNPNEVRLDSPNPSPKTVPSARQGPSLSPSPRRTSGGQRKVSPAHIRASRASTTPSPPRHFSHSNSLSHSSPLSKHFHSSDIHSSRPKSALTPSRRLLGPRHALAQDSPSKSKTVTFQSVPDVKEFESLSTENSLDGSFEIELDSGSEYDRDWVDEAVEEEGDSLEEILAEQEGLEKGMLRLSVRDQRPAEVVGSPSPNPSTQNHDESTTADFVNTLIEEGLFSPQQTPALGQDSTPMFEDQPSFDPPSTEDEGVPYLSTPSMGTGSLMSPMFANIGTADNLPVPETQYPPKDSAGAPYGRTHHAERAALAHSLPPISVSPFNQPNLPTPSDQSIPLNPNVKSGPGTQHLSLSHQSEPFHDPFTAPPLLPANSGSAPMNRTEPARSAQDRINAARQLAAQKLGLGMPRSPGRVVSDEKEDEGSESGSEVDSGSEDDERFYNPKPATRDSEKMTTVQTDITVVKATSTVMMEQTKGWRAVDGEEGEGSVMKRGLPKPPKVQEVRVPSPVQSPVLAPQDDTSEKRSSKLDFSGFALPLINMTSPFFRPTPTLKSQTRIPSNDTSGQSTSEDEARPTTPPHPPVPHRASTAPPTITEHRIPSFEFEEIKLSTEEVLVRKATVIRNPHSPTKSVFQRDEVPPPPAPLRQTSLPQPAAPPAMSEGGSNGSMRVRQRISREMIRETIDRKYADGSISRRPHSAMALSSSSGYDKPTESKRTSVHGNGYSTTIAPPILSASSSLATASTSSASIRNKDLPPPPPQTSTPMMKSHTDNPRPTSIAMDHPSARARSNTQGIPAGEVIQRSSIMGKEPSSGLDKIIAGQSGTNTHISGLPKPSYGPTASIGRPISILQNPHPPRPGSASGGPTPSSSAGLTSSTSAASTQDFGVTGKNRDVSGLSAIQESSRGSRRSRRSLSMSDANGVPEAVRKQPRLTLGLGQDQESISEAFRDEMESIAGDRNYKVREKHVAAASFGNTVSHAKAGDIDGGKAWRQLRRPSDINEHAAEIRAMRNREVSHGKASGTIFVKVLGIESLVVPVPSQPTFFCMTLDNGIDYIRTPYTQLQDGARVNQEFALVEHPNFEFSLSMDVRRDPHIIRALQDQNHLTVQNRVPSLTQPKPTNSTTSGIRNLFSSPRKPKCTAPPPPPAPSSRPITPAQSPAPADTIARYLATPNSSTIAKTHVAFRPISKQCEAKVLEIRYPMFAMFKGEPDRPREGGKGSVPPNTPRRQVAKVTLQVFRLPPLPGIKPEDLPQCIDECLRGMRHHAWHECEYHEGNLTQEGGDCTIPRRRMFKLIGGNLVAYNEITRKEVTTIDLRQATGVTDLNPDQSQRDLQSASKPVRLEMDDEGMGMFGARPRSFRVEFKGGQGIVFSADRDTDKATWMETLSGLIGKIPSNPLWAELLSTITKDKLERQTARSVSRSTMSTSSGPSHSHAERKRETSQAMGKTRSAPARAGGEGGRGMEGRKGEGVV